MHETQQEFNSRGADEELVLPPLDMVRSRRTRSLITLLFTSGVMLVGFVVILK